MSENGQNPQDWPTSVAEMQHPPESPSLVKPAGNGVEFSRSSSAEETQIESGKIIFVFPAYNEEESLPPLLDRIQRVFKNYQRDYNVIIVNDGSSDDTELIASQYSFRMPLTLVNHEVNKGFGAAVETGMSAAAKIANDDDIIVTMDADNTQPPETIQRMVAWIEDGYDVIIASRYRAGARVVGVPFLRNIYSLGARGLFTVFFPTRGVRDYTSGFRAIRASIIRRGFEKYGERFFSEDGFSATVDTLLKMRALDEVLFYEVPLILRYDQKEGESKMNVSRTIKQTLSLIAKRRMGKY